jgi:ABC-type dipeptide/oligopeptide/nickel transport system ATPase component
VLRVEDLKISLKQARSGAAIINGLSFSVAPGEILGLVGESGCGKSVTARSIAGLNRFDSRFRTDGRVLFRGRDLLSLDSRAFRRISGREIGMIFQNPMTSLNPLQRIGM